MEGWIKLYRKLLDHPVFRSNDPMLLKTFVYCLLRAGYEEKDHFFNHQLIHLEPGQFIIGRERGAKDLGSSPKTFDRKIHDLQIMEIVTRSSTHRFSIISIINWDAYQNRSEKDDPLNGTNMHGTCTEPDHKQEVKNKKKVKERKNSPPTPSKGEIHSPSKGKVSGGWDRERELDPNRVPGYSEDGTVCFIPQAEDEWENLFSYLTKSWNYFLADIDKPAHQEKVGLSPTEITPQRMALIRARVKEWPDFYWRWVSVIANIWRCPFMLGENQEKWQAHFDWTLKPGVARRICEENLNDLKVLKSLRAMDEELFPGLHQVAEVPTSSPGNGDGDELQGADTQEGEPEESYPRNQLAEGADENDDSLS
ncbi:MAG: hypothetical protein NTV04_20080 [Deltaproteobacteria bacterium]|nr:hypothetical protein [Deltaproteobacteria bacterium]